MTVSRSRKSQQLAALEALLGEATSVGFVTTQKVTVEEVSNLKKELRASDAYFLVAKKTLMRIAFKNVYNADLDISTLPGQVALIIAKGDKVAGLGITNKYATAWKKDKKITFVGAYFDGTLMDAENATKLATLPSREVLLAKLLGSMLSPLSGLARFFDGAKTKMEENGLTTAKELIALAPVVEKTEEAAAE